MNNNTNKANNPMKVITGPDTRWSYANVWEAKSINGGAPKFSVSLIIPKSDTKTVAKIKAAIEDQHGIKIHFIMTDYVQLIPVEDYNIPGKFITQPTQQMVEISKRLKTRTKREQFGYIFLSQVPKEVAGNGTFVLYAEDMKDSMALQAMSDWVFTMWLLAPPYKRHYQ